MRLIHTSSFNDFFPRPALLLLGDEVWQFKKIYIVGHFLDSFPFYFIILHFIEELPPQLPPTLPACEWPSALLAGQCVRGLRVIEAFSHLHSWHSHPLPSAVPRLPHTVDAKPGDKQDAGMKFLLFVTLPYIYPVPLTFPQRRGLRKNK